MSWCEFDNWSSSGVEFDQRLKILLKNNFKNFKITDFKK